MYLGSKGRHAGHAPEGVMPHRQLILIFCGGLLVAFLFFPLLGTMAALSGVVVAQLKRRDFNVPVFLAAALFVLSFGPLIALKLPTDILGNDKAQYIEFMKGMISSGVGDYLETQPEYVSMMALYMSGLVFGVNDFAFFVMFAFSISALIFVVGRVERRALPLFLIVLVSSSAFFGSYGNLIRQAMAFPFFVGVFLSRDRLPASAYAAISILTHLPSAMIILPYMVARYFGRFGLSAVFGSLFFLMFSSQVMDFGSVLGSDFLGGYLDKKTELYADWERYSVAGVAITAVILVAVSNWIYWLSKGGAAKIWNGAGADVSARLSQLLLGVNVAALVLFCAYDFNKVFERLFIYLFMLVSVFLGFSLLYLKRRAYRAAISIFFVLYSFYGFSKNLASQDLLYHGRPLDYLTTSLFEGYSELIGLH